MVRVSRVIDADGGGADAGILDRPSPNHDARCCPVDMLVLHYTGMADAASALARLRDPQARVSAHYMIDEDGAVFRLVPESRRAWHAGVAEWAGDRRVNDRSIGIELVNPGHEHGPRPFPEAQIAVLEALAGAVVRRHPIAPRRVVGHSDVAPARKRDPGELFDWARLARAGIGLWPAPAPPHETAARDDGGLALAPGARSGAVRAAQAALAAWGYGLCVTGVYDTATADTVTAFQRHFRPRRIDGVFDAECGALLRALARLAA